MVSWAPQSSGSTAKYCGKLLYRPQVHPHGSVDGLPFDAMGSGSLNAISMLETYYKDDMSKEEAMRIVGGAIRYGAPSASAGVFL